MTQNYMIKWGNLRSNNKFSKSRFVISSDNSFYTQVVDNRRIIKGFFGA